MYLDFITTCLKSGKNQSKNREIEKPRDRKIGLACLVTVKRTAAAAGFDSRTEDVSDLRF